MTDEVLNCLIEYSTKTAQLGKAIISHVPAHTTISYRTNEPIKVDGQIDITIEGGLVLLIRRFFDEKDAISFLAIANVILRINLDNHERVKRIREYKKQWRSIYNGTNPLFSLGDQDGVLTNKKIFELFAYAEHIHGYNTNKDKLLKEQYKQIKQNWLWPMSKVQLESMILSLHALLAHFNYEFVIPLLDDEKRGLN